MKGIAEAVDIRHRPATEAAHRDAIHRVIAAMRDRPDEELSLDAMADLAYISPYHFLRVFREHTGVPPGQFLKALRLEEAKRLLLTTDHTVTDICFRVGYSSLGTFSRNFTRQVGLPPRELRRLGREFAFDGIERLAERLQPPPDRPAVAGELTVDPDFTGVFFLGLFDTPVPQDRPLSCGIRFAAGTFHMALPPEGRYYLYAAGLSSGKGPLDTLLGSAVARVGRAGPLEVAGAAATGSPDLEMRPPDPLDPPLLVTLPLLLAERLDGTRAADA